MKYSNIVLSLSDLTPAFYTKKAVMVMKSLT